MSNTERQREFRRKNPGYYRRLHARRRAAAQALAEAKRLAAEAAHAAPVQQQITCREPLALPAPPTRLALPAPAETIEIPGMTTLPTFDALRAREQAIAPIPQIPQTSDR